MHPVTDEVVSSLIPKYDTLAEKQQGVENSILVAGSVAGAWALDRRLSGEYEMTKEEAIRSVILPSSSKDLKMVLEQFVGPDLLRSRYVPRFVLDAVSEVDTTVSKWTVVIMKFVHDDINVDMCVICSPDDMMNDVLHLELLETAMFTLDCVSKVNDLLFPDEDFNALRRRLPEAMTITCFMTEEDRGLPATVRQPLDVLHVNAGVTHIPEHNILVYRKQHAHKVLIHEIIHCLGLDTELFKPSTIHSDKQTMRLLNYHSSTDTLNGYEAYVEVLACFWHMFFSVPEVVVTDGVSALDALWQLWSAEAAHFEEVCSLIISHFMLDDTDEDDTDEDDADDSYMSSKDRARILAEVRQAGMSERTHVFSYFFAKAALWEKLDELPVFPYNKKEARTFWKSYNESTTDPAFWRRVLRSSASKQLSMTSLGR